MIRDSFSYKSKAATKKYPPSQTVPDQAYTVAEMVRRFHNGQQLYTMPAPVFTAGEDIVPLEWEQMDEMERRDFARSIASRKDAIQQALIEKEELEKAAQEQAAAVAAEKSKAKDNPASPTSAAATTP